MDPWAGNECPECVHKWESRASKGLCVNTLWDMQGAVTRVPQGQPGWQGTVPAPVVQHRPAPEAQTRLSDQQKHSGLLLLPFHSQAVPWEVPCAHMLHTSLLESVPSHHCLFHGQMQPHWAWVTWKAAGVPSIQQISTLRGVLLVHSSDLLQF